MKLNITNKLNLRPLSLNGMCTLRILYAQLMYTEPLNKYIKSILNQEFYFNLFVKTCIQITCRFVRHVTAVVII